jgi:hypothetical protein
MILALRSVLAQTVFVAGLFALLFIAMSSSSEGLSMSVQIHSIPLPTLEAQPVTDSLGLP